MAGSYLDTVPAATPRPAQFLVAAGLVEAASAEVAGRTRGLGWTLLAHVLTVACGVRAALYRLGHIDVAQQRPTCLTAPDPQQHEAVSEQAQRAERPFYTGPFCRCPRQRPCPRLESNIFEGKEDAMARYRTVAAVAVFLFGTTFLWFMPSFLGTGATVDGVIWSVTQLLVLATVAGYAGAAWGLYKATAWWRPLAIGGSIVGTLVLLLWWLAVSSLSGVGNMAANLALHAIGIAMLLLALPAPSLGRGLDRRLGGRSRHGT